MEVVHKQSKIRLKVLKIYGHKFSGTHLLDSLYWKVGERQTNLLVSDFNIIFDMKEYIISENKTKDALISYIKKAGIKI